jgi:hypothetical protein
MKKLIKNSLLALLCALVLFVPRPTHAEPKEDNILLAAGVAAFSMGYLNQFTVAFAIRKDSPRSSFIPIIGPMQFIHDAIHTDCSGAFEWNCGIVAMIFFGSVQLGLEGTGLALFVASGSQEIAGNKTNLALSMPLLQFNF